MATNKNTSNDIQPEQPDAKDSKLSSLLAKIKNHKRIWIGSAIAVFILLGGIYALTNQSHPKSSTARTYPNTETKQEDNTVAQEKDLFMQQSGQGCKERKVSFTSPPMNMSDLGYIRPLGAVSDSHVTPTDHVYIGGSNFQAAANTYPVLMPADGTVTQVAAMPAQYIGDRKEQKTASEDHNILISHSCRYFTNYIHINKLSDKLVAAAGHLQPNERKQTSVELKAGEVIGYVGGTTFDWIPIDTETTLKGFITPSLYQGESWKIHVVSPFDLYSGSLKAQLEAKSQRTVPPLGSRIDYDQPGKLVGNWFREGTNGYAGSNSEGRSWDGHLSIVPDYLDPSYTILSIGNWTGSAKQMTIAGNPDTSKVSKDTGMVVYELRKLSYVSASNGQLSQGMAQKGLHPDSGTSLEGSVAVQVLPGEKLKIEKFPGKSAAQVKGFTDAALTYER